MKTFASSSKPPVNRRESYRLRIVDTVSGPETGSDCNADFVIDQCVNVIQWFFRNYAKWVKVNMAKGKLQPKVKCVSHD